MKRDFSNLIAHYIQLEIDTLKKLDQTAIQDVMNVLEGARERGATIYICGNGGSASTASHFASDFNKGVNCELEHKQKFKFICLSDNVPSMMAIANDIGYDQVFKVPIENLITSEDVFIGISGSGNSPNVILAAEYAKSVGAKVVGITGYSGGKLYQIADYRLHVPLDNMQITEDIHLIFEHLMMWILAYGN